MAVDDLEPWNVFDMMLDEMLNSVSSKLSGSGKTSTPPPSGQTGGETEYLAEGGLVPEINSALASVLNKLDSIVGNTAEVASNPSVTSSPLPGGTPSGKNPNVQNVPIPPPSENAVQQAANDILRKLAEHTGTPQAPAGGGAGGQQPPGGPPSFGNTPLYDSGPPPGDTPDERSTFQRIAEGIAGAISSQLDFVRRGFQHVNRAVDDPGAMIEAGQREGGFGGRVQAAAGFGIRGLQQDRELRGAGDLAAGAGELAGGVPVVGKPVQSFFKLTEVVTKSVDRLKQWNDRLHEGNLRFAEFSGSMFAVAQEQEARRIQLSIEQGERRADSARYQAEAKARLDRTLAPVEDAFGKLKNYIGGFMAESASKIIDKLSLGALSGVAPPAGQSLYDWMKQVQEEESKNVQNLIPPPGAI